jgi:hypothetical protein
MTVSGAMSAGTSRLYRIHRSGGEITLAAEQEESSKDVANKMDAGRCIVDVERNSQMIGEGEE